MIQCSIVCIGISTNFYQIIKLQVIVNMFMGLSRFMNQEALDKKVSSYFSNVVSSIKKNDINKASKASDSLNQLSASTFTNAIFRLSMIEAMHSSTPEYKDDKLCIDYICEHLPLYLSRGSSLLVSSNPLTALRLAEKISKKPEGAKDSYWFGSGIINNAGLVVIAMAEKGHALPMTIILDLILKQSNIYESNISVNIDLIKPLITLKNNKIIRDYVCKREKDLIDLVLTVPSYMSEFCGPAIDFDIAVEITDIGSSSFAKAVFQENHNSLCDSMPINFLIESEKRIGSTFEDLISMSIHTFVTGYGKSNPYRYDRFKYFAHYFINSESNLIPFVKLSKKLDYDNDVMHSKTLVALDNPSYIKGLKEAIAASDPSRTSRVHKLVHALKSITTNSEILAAIAHELPDDIIIHHKDLNKTRLYNDLGM
jgi:hypothetical protein